MSLSLKGFLGTPAAGFTSIDLKTSPKNGDASARTH
jgi:hypothetical protein